MAGREYVPVDGNQINLMNDTTGSGGGQHTVVVEYHVNWDSDGFQGLNWLWNTAGNGIKEWWESSQGNGSGYTDYNSFIDYVSNSRNNLDDAFKQWDNTKKVNWILVNLDNSSYVGCLEKTVVQQ